MAPLQRPGTETLKTPKTCHPVGGPNYSTANSKSKLPKQSSGFDLGVSKTNIMTQQRLRKLHFFPNCDYSTKIVASTNNSPRGWSLTTFR